MLLGGWAGGAGGRMGEQVGGWKGEGGAVWIHVLVAEDLA